jgi:hypothetical protein
MPLPRINFGSIFFGGSVYVVGGWHDAFTQQCDRFEIATDSWHKLPPLQIEREAISLCQVRNEWIYAIGEVLTRGKRFKIVKNRWQYTIERLNIASPEEWEVITVTADSKIDQPCMRNMGCINHYTNSNVIVLFGGGSTSSNQLSCRTFWVDTEKKVITKRGPKEELGKCDRFQNQIFFSDG